ncbi:MAG: TadE/TadG family type IV pilus assembly protein [Clostridiales bacterium]|nr:pilus assembly protein [Eubacteriales bacterium]MDH7565813.1 TadE/TadG family type IV pilus assembly protein [Clostridiales bacterium]
MVFTDRHKGSMTVEASLVLPVFISAVLTMLFLIKLAYIHEVIQHALSETADEMAASSYIYYMSGVFKTYEELQEEVKNKAVPAKEHIAAVLDSLGELKKNDSGDGEDGGEAGSSRGTGNAGKAAESAAESFKKLINAAGEISQNPLQELKSIGYLIAEGAFDDLRTELYIPIARLDMKKYLTAGVLKDAQTRLEKLNVVDGFDGLDLSESEFFEGEDKDIDLIVKYKVNIPVPFKIFPRLQMVQRCVVRAWTNGDEEDAEGDGDNIWALSNFERGAKIRERFGANLPKTFPVIACFEGGTATMIKSMDLTAPYYQSPMNVEEKIGGYIAELSRFKGAKQGDTEIAQGQIARKTLKLIIPENETAPGISAAIDKCVRDAAGKGITLEVIKYQRKKVENTGEGEEGK